MVGGPHASDGLEFRCAHRREAAREDRSVGVGHVDSVAACERALDATDADGQQRAAVALEGATGSRVDDDAAGRFHREGDPELSGRQRTRLGPHDGADPVPLLDRASEDVVEVGAGDHRGDAGVGGHLRGLNLRGHAATPPVGAGAAGVGGEGCGDGGDLADQLGVGVLARIAGVQPGDVGEQHQALRAHEMCDQRRDPVVVAETDRVVGDGVVLVDDGHHAELQEPLECAARVEVLGALEEVERCEEELTGDDAVSGERLLVDGHQAALAHRRGSLQGAGVSGTRGAVEAECRQAGRDRAGADEDDLVTVAARRCDLVAQLGDDVGADVSLVVGERRRADLHDHDHGGHCDSADPQSNAFRRSRWVATAATRPLRSSRTPGCPRRRRRPRAHRPWPTLCRHRAWSGVAGRTPGPLRW